MRYIRRQESRLGMTFCSVCNPVHRIEHNEPCWHEPVRNWHSCDAKAEKFDAWIAVIEDALRTKTPIREAMARIPGAVIAPPAPLCTQKVVDIKTKKPVQGSLF